MVMTPPNAETGTLDPVASDATTFCSWIGIAPLAPADRPTFNVAIGPAAIAFAFMPYSTHRVPLQLSVLPAESAADPDCVLTSVDCGGITTSHCRATTWLAAAPRLIETGTLAPGAAVTEAT